MILTDKKILQAIEEGLIVIDPFRPECLGTNSYDVHLSKYISVYEDAALDARKHNKVIESEIGPEGFLMHPGMLYLGVTEEYTETHHTGGEVKHR
jgi:dCTP deaminase